MIHESLWRRRRTAGHNMVFRWSLVSLNRLCELPEYMHMGNRTLSWDSRSSAPFGKDRCVVYKLQASHNRSNFLTRDFEYCSLCGDLQRICGSTWWWQTPKRLFSAGWSHMPHLELEHGRNRKLFWWPDYFESFMAAKISWLKNAWFFPVWWHKSKSLCQQATHHTGTGNNIRHEIPAISLDNLQATFANIKHRVQLCLDSGGQYFQHLLR